MSRVIFQGSVTAQATAGETVTITVTLPDGSTETLTAQTLADRTYSTEKTYAIAGNYSAKAHGDADSMYVAWDSNTVPFTISVQTRTGTLIVTVE